jgi:hypothetical protein
LHGVEDGGLLEVYIFESVRIQAAAMDKFLLEQLVQQLKYNGAAFEEGLTDAEIQNIEAKNGFFFPSDLKAFLQYALPVSIEQHGRIDYFPRWRLNPDSLVKTFQKNLLNGIIWQLEHNNRFWLERWGTKPSNLTEAAAIIRRDYETAPILVPVYGHRCIASRPKAAGNPVFSIVGIDIIIYGTNLLNYFKKEFHLKALVAVKSKPIKIDFWQDLWAHNNTPLF